MKKTIKPKIKKNKTKQILKERQSNQKYRIKQSKQRKKSNQTKTNQTINQTKSKYPPTQPQPKTTNERERKKGGHTIRKSDRNRKMSDRPIRATRGRDGGRREGGVGTIKRIRSRRARNAPKIAKTARIPRPGGGSAAFLS